MDCNNFFSYVYKDKKNNRWAWRIKFRKTDGTLFDKKTTGFATKKEANTDLLKYQMQNDLKEQNETEIINNSITNKTMEFNCAISLKFLYDKYIEYSKVRLKSSSLRSASDCLIKYVISYFGENKNVGTIKTIDVINWQTYILGKNFSFKYNSKIYCAFTALLNYGIKFYDLPYNVAERVGNFRNSKPKKEMSFWTEEEFINFYEKNDYSEYKLFYTVLYFTGMRKGDLLAATWKDIDLEKKEIVISKSLNRKKPEKNFESKLEESSYSTIGWHNIGRRFYEITTTKTKASFRRVILTDNIISLLKDHYIRCKTNYNFSSDWFIFGGDLPFSDQTIRRKFDEMADKAGVKRIRIHDLRHSHASLLINKGQNILIVSQRLGHSDVKQTLNTYSHLMPNVQKEILNAINIKL